METVSKGKKDSSSRIKKQRKTEVKGVKRGRSPEGTAGIGEGEQGGPAGKQD